MTLQPIHLLLMALVSLIVAPILHRLLRTRPKALRAIEVSSVCVVLGIVLLHILPESFEDSGWVAAPLLVLGFGLPVFLECYCNEKIHNVQHLSLWFVTLGFAIHSMIDGAAIAAPQDSEHLMAWAVIAHRVPTALFLWCMLFPRFGYKMPSLALLGIGIATTIGFVLGLVMLSDLEGNFAIGIFQAIVAGSLLHVIVGHRLIPSLHKHSHDDGELGDMTVVGDAEDAHAQGGESAVSVVV